MPRRDGRGGTNKLMEVPMKTLCVMLLGSGLLAGVEAPRGAKATRSTVQGTWKAISYEEDGEKAEGKVAANRDDTVSELRRFGHPKVCCVGFGAEGRRVLSG